MDLRSTIVDSSIGLEESESEDECSISLLMD